MRIGELLSPALERLGPKGLWTESKLRKLWPVVVGDAVAANARVRRLRGDVLEVEVASDAWATELSYLAAEVRQKLNERLGGEVVSELVVRRGRRRS
jgi:predicted nucleic acid-binding Zn ribbon protein